MPGFLTHYVAGQELLKNLPVELVLPIEPNERLFNLGTQGPDFFFYYFQGQLSKESRSVGTVMHLSNLGRFLCFMANQTKDKEKREAEAIFAYTAGFIMHYCLDSHAHPYVYARTESKSNTKLKNSADHRKFETAIDIRMLNMLQDKKPADYNQWEIIKADEFQLSKASHALSLGLHEVYKRRVSPSVVKKAMRQMVIFTRLLQSKTGRRKRLVNFAEKLTIKEPLFSSMVHLQEVTDNEGCLNLNNAEWCPPWDGASTESYSFVELFNRAVEDASRMVDKLYGFVFGETSLEEMQNELGNRSLKTGFDSNPDTGG